MLKVTTFFLSAGDPALPSLASVAKKAGLDVCRNIAKHAVNARDRQFCDFGYFGEIHFMIMPQNKYLLHGL